MPHAKGKGGKKAYVQKEKRQIARAKKTTSEDINQNYEIKNLKKEVKELKAGTKNFVGFRGNGDVVARILGRNNNDPMSFFQICSPTDLLTGTGIYTPPAQINGSFISIPHLAFKYQLDMDPASDRNASGTSMTTRVMVVCVHQPSGDPALNSQSQPPSWADIFLTNHLNGTALISADMLSHYTRMNRHNFEVLHDKIHVLSPCDDTVGTQACGVGKPFTSVESVSLVPQKRSQKVAYNDIDATPVTLPTAVAQNCYYVFAFSDNAVAANATPVTITWNIVVDYID